MVMCDFDETGLWMWTWVSWVGCLDLGREREGGRRKGDRQGGEGV